MKAEPQIATWRSVLKSLQRQPAGTSLKVPRHLVEHPSAAGLRVSVELPVGQRSSYGLKLGSGETLAVTDFGSHYIARIRPAVMSTAPAKGEGATSATYLAAGIALGGLVGALLSRRKEGVLAAAAVGGLVAMIGREEVNADRAASEWETEGEPT